MFNRVETSFSLWLEESSLGWSCVTGASITLFDTVQYEKPFNDA